MSRLLFLAISLLEYCKLYFVLVSERNHLTLVGRANLRVFFSGVRGHVLGELGARESDNFRECIVRGTTASMVRTSIVTAVSVR